MPDNVIRRKLKQITPIRFLARTVRNWYEIQYAHLVLRQYRDFELKRMGAVYHLCFNNRFGYQPTDWRVTFRFDYKRWVWIVNLNDWQGLTYGCPIWDLTMELRGYLLVYQPELGDTVIDVGASTGFVATMLAQMVGPQGQVLCVEPDPRNYRILQEIIELNQLSHCVTVNVALSSQDGTARFVSNGGASRIVAGSSHQPSAEAIVPVRTRTLHSLLETFPDLGSTLKLIKLDVEGSELELLDDLLALLRTNPRLVIVIASYHLAHGVPTARTIEQRCQAEQNIIAKTIFPLHTTTVLIHSANSAALHRLATLPSYHA